MTTINTLNTVTDELRMVGVDFDICSGVRTAEEIKSILDGKQVNALPNRIPVLPDDMLTDMRSLRDATLKNLRQAGFRYMGAYMVSATKLAEVETMLNEAEERFLALKDKALADYQTTSADFLSSVNEDMQTVTSRLMYSPIELEEKLNVQVAPVQLVQAYHEDGQVKLEAQLLAAAISDVARTSRNIVTSFFRDKKGQLRDKVSKSGIAAINDLNDKVQALPAGNEAFAYVRDGFKRVLAILNGKSALEGPTLTLALDWCHVIGNPDAIHEYSQGLKEFRFEESMSFFENDTKQDPKPVAKHSTSTASAPADVQEWEGEQNTLF
jgi:hypothetical protein